MSKETLKKEIILTLDKYKDTLSAFSILQKIKGKNQNLNLTVKSIGSACGELVREGIVMKEWKIRNKENGFYTLTSTWLKKTENWIKSRIPFAFPEVIVSLELIKDGIMLSGRTRGWKENNKIKVLITIYVSEMVLGKKNIQQGIKLILIHEMCHVVNVKNPDNVMKQYFPKEYKMWKLATDAQALECGVEYTAK